MARLTRQATWRHSRLSATLAEHQRTIGAAEPEGVGQHHIDLHGACLIGYAIQIAFRIRCELIDGGRRLNQGQEFPLSVLQGSTGLIRRFVEDYHEKDEEKYLFTRFYEAGKMVDLVNVLYQQHQRGREVTARIQSLTSPAVFKPGQPHIQVLELMAAFTRMYRPHAAREDTVLYPAFRSVISPKDFMALGEAFENKEEKLFGKNGFEKIVGQVADLENQLGIYQLTNFTPSATLAGGQPG